MHSIEELAKMDVLLEFTSTTCGVCRKMKPMVSELLATNKDLHFSILNVDEDGVMDLANTYQVSSLPTFIHIKEGNVVGRTSGFKKLSELRDFLKL